ncbi:MAG TPA: methylaspartate mutase subunit E [Planctomycetota bacterium]|nr:methylaspartate mutase subunit E [Planctomycetota bacterium]
MDLASGRIPIDAFMKERPAVLAAWPTGREVERLEDGFACQAAVPEAKRFAAALDRADAAGESLVQPRAGVCLVDEHIKLLRQLEAQGGADLLPTTIDSYTRQNRYAEAAAGIEESKATGRSLLNGFPAVNHGVEACRRVTAAVGRPVQVRHGTPDARLLAEITLAGGFTAYEGGGISYNIPYAKNVPLDRSIAWWQYCDRLVGLYAENGVVVNREPFGPLTGTMVPPCISNAVAVIEALLAAEQGVRSISVGYGQCGNLYQDVAAVQSLRGLCRTYLERFGWGDVRLSTVFHQWMGGFPTDEAQAFAVISWGTVAAAFSRATKIISKTPHEASGIPTAEANVAGLKTTRQVLCMFREQQDIASAEVERERAQIDRETSLLIETALRLGEGSIAAGAVRAFQAGALDVPFAPSRAARGAVMPVRDLHGAVRFFDFGGLPFDEGIKDFHRRAVSERARAERRQPSFQMVTDDIYAVSKGRLVGKPR